MKSRWRKNPRVGRVTHFSHWIWGDSRARFGHRPQIIPFFPARGEVPVQVIWDRTGWAMIAINLYRFYHVLSNHHKKKHQHHQTPTSSNRKRPTSNSALHGPHGPTALAQDPSLTTCSFGHGLRMKPSPSQTEDETFFFHCRAGEPRFGGALSGRNLFGLYSIYYNWNLKTYYESRLNIWRVFTRDPWTRTLNNGVTYPLISLILLQSLGFLITFWVPASRLPGNFRSPLSPTGCWRCDVLDSGWWLKHVFQLFQAFRTSKWNWEFTASRFLGWLVRLCPLIR